MAINLPAPKLDPFGELDTKKASPLEMKGQVVFLGKGRCAECHISQTSFLDNNMHDLKLERFYTPGKTYNGMVTLPDGPIKTFTLRGKDSPPYLHDGRLLTLDDTGEFFNLVLGTKLATDEKKALVGLSSNALGERQCWYVSRLFFCSEQHACLQRMRPIQASCRQTPNSNKAVLQPLHRRTIPMISFYNWLFREIRLNFHWLRRLRNTLRAIH